MEKKKIVIASDSFKGTLSSIEICRLFQENLENRKDIEAVYVPIADGGEGSLDAISSVLKGHFENVKVNDLYFNEIETRFFVDENKNAYIEAASCVGLKLAKENNDPGLVTTYGLGEQILKAIELGCKNIYLFLGGSASNDGGAGLLSALGVMFFDKNGKEFVPQGYTLHHINKINVSKALENINKVNIVGLTDVQSPLYGPKGAAYKFAPQKGANDSQVKELDDNLKSFAEVIIKELGIDISSIPGSGAAGGLGGGLSVLGIPLKSGINTLLDLIHFEEIIKDADYIVSGEGKLDKQTFDGKVIDGVANYCLKRKKPLVLLVGTKEVTLNDIKQVYPCVTHIYENNEKHLPFEEVKKNAKEDYKNQISLLLNNL